MKRLSLAFSFLVCQLAFCYAQAPGGSYYQTANGLKGATLKTKLSGIISNKTHQPTYDELIELYKKTDTRPDGCVRDWYSNITNFQHVTDKAGSYKKEGDVYNREHSVPQSWGAPKADIVHVIPTDGYVNGRRGNLPFGEVGDITYQSANGYSKVGSCKTPGYSGTVFEPNDEVKGDLARIYFYMATCYESTITSWSGGGVITGNKYQPYADWTFDMLLRWSKLDPVDDVERARNEAIAKNDVQGNRNPFVDYPGLEDYIWGSKKDVAFSYDHYEGGGDIVIVDRVAQPVISPDGGSFTEPVEVTISCDTEGATIYYTTNGAEASVNSHVYDGPFTLNESATVKAIAMKEGLSTSYQSIAQFVISSELIIDQPVEGTIALNNGFFKTSFSGSVTSGAMGDFTGTQNGITVTYGKGSGSNQYISDTQIRLYPGNTLTVSTAQGILTEVEFTIDLNKGGKTMQATTGTVNDNFVWTGSSNSITFSVNSGSGHLQISKIKVSNNSTTGIDATTETPLRMPFHSLSGARVDSRHLRPGVYIQNGKKVIIR